MEATVRTPDSIAAGISDKPSGVTPKQRLWLSRIKKEKKCHKAFRERAEEVEEIWRKGEDNDELYVPLYWQLVSIEHTGVYSNQPVPDVRPRNERNEPVMRDVAQCISRALAFCVDQESFDENMHRAVDDFLAIGLGALRCKIDSVINRQVHQVPIFRNVITGFDPVGNPLLQEQQVGTREEVEETIGDQAIWWQFVPWSCFGWEPCNNWRACQYIYFRHRMTQAQQKERFGRIVSGKKDKHGDPSKPTTTDVYEIWCKRKREVLFLAEGENDLIEINEDPLGLINFYPMPRAMMMNLPSDKIIPQSDYDYVEPYDVEINRLHERRMGILEQIRASGAYDNGLPELAEMFENEDGQYTSVANLFQRLNAAGGKDNFIYHLPLQEKVETLNQLTQQITFVRQQVDEVLGISDIVRGVTAASETATAQEIKGRWVGVRLTRKRELVQFTVREMMRIMAQLLGSHITPENLQRMTQMQITDQMLQIMQDDVLMSFAIDIETDSTVAKDEFREMQTKQEMLNGVAQFAQSVLPMVQQNQIPAGVASAILRSALNPYARYDRNLETELGNLPQTMQQMQQLTQQLQQSQQQLQQAQMQSQQMQQQLQYLQQQAAEAKAQREMADAGKKDAERREIEAGLPADALEREDKQAGIALKQAQSVESLARADAAVYPPKRNGAM